MKTITVYKCDYCGEIRRTLKGIGTHEVQCFKNPDSLNCYLCENADIDEGPYCKYSEEDITENIASECAEYVNCHKTIFERLRNEVDAKNEKIMEGLMQ